MKQRNCNIVILAECEYGVNVTPPIDILPLFANGFLNTVYKWGQFYAEDIDGG